MDNVNKYPEDKFLDRYGDKEKKVFEKIDYHKKYTLMSIWMHFFIFSIAGWLWEVAYHFFSRGELVNRGALHGPWVPIYGVAAALILGLLQRWVDRPVLVFNLIILISALIEYFTSYMLEKLKGIRFWDYSQDFLNLHGRIYLEGIIFFGIGGCITLYLLAPLLEDLHQKMPRRIKCLILLVLTVLFAVDIVFSYYTPNIANGVTYVKK